MAKKPPTDLAWKATAALATVAAGIVAQQAVAVGWRLVAGRPAPKDIDLLDSSAAEVIAFAVVSGAALAVTRQLALRQAASWYGGKDLNPLTGQRQVARA